MKTILIDSDVLIEVSRGRDAAVLKQWEELGVSDAVPLCSPVTVAEIWHGARSKEHATLAATAAVHGAALWTRNRKHYPMPER